MPHFITKVGPLLSAKHDRHHKSNTIFHISQVFYKKNEYRGTHQAIIPAKQ